MDALARDLKQIFDRFPTAQTPNESQTENDLIWPIQSCLGWTQFLRNQNLSARGREDVPDGLLFENQDAKARVNTFREEWKRYEFGRAIIESNLAAVLAISGHDGGLFALPEDSRHHWLKVFALVFRREAFLQPMAGLFISERSKKAGSMRSESPAISPGWCLASSFRPSPKQSPPLHQMLRCKKSAMSR